ncbi:MAG: hypothetical protein F4017_05045 [Acidimicrobiaceae bacterium]|nr:hypothetical protein [Acidimicrobiaceae bacterium]MYK73945.1 hypothetical protein [Acidimicrobiaceae bacterium]
MSDQTIDVEAVLADLKDFQHRTAVWAFDRMFDETDPAVRFLVADEVGLGKTHVAKGVIAKVIDYLGQTGDERHDIVYVCSNMAIASQNVRKLAPGGVKPIEGVRRLTMLPLAQLDEGDDTRRGINLLAITPATSLQFGRRTGTFPERALAYAFLRAHWGKEALSSRPARRIFWHGIRSGDPNKRLREWERGYRPLIAPSLDEFGRRLDEADADRAAAGEPSIRDLFDELVAGLAHKRTIPWPLYQRLAELIGELRRVMALVGLDSMRPDLVVLDEFQRFKDLLKTEPDSLAAEMAQQLLNYTDPETGRATRTLLLSATPYRMYTTSDEIEDDHYQDFLETCSFLFGHDPARIERLQVRFRELRTALTAGHSLDRAEALCEQIGAELRSVMARTERLSATPDRSGMLAVPDAPVAVKVQDLRAHLRFGGLADAVNHHEPAEYWKSAPYLVNFMEGYKFKDAVEQAAKGGQFTGGEMLDPGPGLLNWDHIDEYQRIDPQNGRLRWLLDDLESRRAFELLWVPPSMRYYDAGSVYESPEAAGFTKRLIFSGWTVVPKVVSSLVSFESERQAFAARSHRYTDDYSRRGGRRLTFRTTVRAEQPRPGEAAGHRRAAAMTAFLLVWPSPSLAEMGDPRPRTGGRPRVGETRRDATGTHIEDDGDRPERSVERLRDEVRARVNDAIERLKGTSTASGAVDQRWYWAAPLLLDEERWPAAAEFLLDPGNAWYFQGGERDDEDDRSASDDRGDEGLHAHLDEARAMVAAGAQALGRPPADLAEALTDLAVGGPAQCALRMICSVARLDPSDDYALLNAAWLSGAFRHYFNAPEVTAVVEAGDAGGSKEDEGSSRYWLDVVRHCVNGNLQAVLDEHGHVLRDWRGHLSLDNHDRRCEAADDIAETMAEALELRTSSYRVDFPVRSRKGRKIKFGAHRMRTRFAVAFADQRLDDGSVNRIGSVSVAFNSPFWPFVLASTSIGQEGLDFHLWCHAVVHWNLPHNPVDLEQREGRVHRYKGHAVRRNIAATLGSGLFAAGLDENADLWDELFAAAVAGRPVTDSEVVPYWVFSEGPAKIERHVPVMPFSREQAALPRLRKALAAYRLAFGQPRQEELVEWMGANLADEDLKQLTERLRVDLSPPS